MSQKAGDEQGRMDAATGDVLFARDRMPYPGLILQGFHRRHRAEPELEPYVSFRHLQKLLEFLEFVVLTERIVVPVPMFSKRTERIVSSRRNWMDFAVFTATGDLDFKTEAVVDRLTSAGVLFDAHIGVGDPTADDVTARLMPGSKKLQAEFARRLSVAQQYGRSDPFSYASAEMAYWYGAPLHVAEAAAIAKVPYVLSSVDEKHLTGFENETLRTRKAVTEILLDRLNIRARREIARLVDLGADMQFPETPIASMIVRNAASPMGLVDAALELRSEFAEYRYQMNQLESDLANKSLPLKVRLKRAREIQMLAESLWPSGDKDLRAATVGVADAFLAIPEIATGPSPSTIKLAAEKLIVLPIERIVDLYRSRRVRILLKAKRDFLHAPDLEGRIAHILRVPAEVVSKSRRLKQPNLTARYAAKHPDVAAEWYGKRSAA